MQNLPKFKLKLKIKLSIKNFMFYDVGWSLKTNYSKNHIVIENYTFLFFCLILLATI